VFQKKDFKLLDRKRCFLLTELPKGKYFQDDLHLFIIMI